MGSIWCSNKAIAIILAGDLPESGPFIGTMRSLLGGKYELDPQDVLAALDAALQGVVMRGKANLGDKTMVDALTPAVNALREALQKGANIVDALERAASAAEQGMKDTIPMLAKRAGLVISVSAVSGIRTLEPLPNIFYCGRWPMWLGKNTAEE